MESKIRILVIDDDRAGRANLKNSLQSSGLVYEFIECTNQAHAMEVLNRDVFDCIFLEYHLGGANDLSLLKHIRQSGVKTPVVMTTAQGSENIAVELMKAGASDYIIKSQVNNFTVPQILRNMVHIARIEREREAAIKATELSEARLAEAQRIAKIGNWELNYEKGTVYWSPQVFSIFELDPARYTPTADKNMEFIYADDRKIVSDILKTSKEGNQFNIDVRIVTSSGIKYTNMQGYALASNGKVTGSVGIIQDITERKLFEQEILQSRKMAESAVKAREIFLSNMSHEIRTPMNAILGFTRLLHDTSLTPEQKSFLEAIHFSGEKLLVIINDILDLSKIQSGKMTFEKAEFNLSELIKSITTNFKQKAAEKGLQFTYQIRQHVPNILKGDAARLNQVLTNLLNNAIKFTEKGNVHLEVLSTGAYDGKYALEFKVTDTGIGIPEEKQAQVFESFVQGTGDTTRKYEGTGLGLTIVKSIVELQEGKIALKSASGKGSTFTISLAFDQAVQHVQHAEINSTTQEVIESLEGISVLVVEDNAVNQLLVKKVLQKFGCKTDVASNGVRAIESLRTGRYDIVLMDIQMPEMDGFEATQYIRTKLPPPVCNIPIIAMTAHSFVPEVEKTKKVGMTDYIIKPFRQEVLFEVLCKNVVKVDDAKVVPFHQRHDTSKFIIDLNPLYALSKDDDDFIVEIIRVYDKQTQKFTERLREAMRSHNYNMIKSTCHQIKGSYGMLRMNELKKNLEETEMIFQRESYKADFEKLCVLVDNIISLISAVNEEVKRKLRQSA
jgi:signal transduction histidine kinase/DNA-binding response OmpR family regulator/HPt (histidine-containing phosphotransfer) domain-containing protein